MKRLGTTPEPEAEGCSLRDHLRGLIEMADAFLSNTYSQCSATEVLRLMAFHGRDIRSAMPQMEFLQQAPILRSYLFAVHMRIDDVMRACSTGLHSSDPRMYLLEAWDNMQLLQGYLAEALERGEANALSSPWKKGSYPWDADLANDFAATEQRARLDLMSNRRERSLAATRLQLKASYGNVIAPALFAPHKTDYAALQTELAGITGQST